MLPSAEALFSSLVNGLITGSTYALMAVGFTLVYGIMRVINFAHGALYMVGAYAAYLAISYLGFDPIVSIGFSFIAVFLLGMIIERFLVAPIRKLKGDQLVNSILVTLGLSIFLENIMLEIFGAYPKGEVYYYPGTVDFFNVTISFERIIFLVTGVVSVSGFAFFTRYSRLGKAIRAVAMNPEAATVAGIDLPRIYMLTFAISSGLAATAGALLLPMNFAHPFVGQEPLRTMFVVVVLGGLGSIVGALLAGFILGITKSVVTLLFGSVVHDIAAFVILLLILLVRPQGLMGWEKPRI
ncbi:MAG: branched-chain amino acid ABC transporter permease [Candidatus Caldarchaeum sp.]|nr:branched-chain amino acid ABC transporter permease [Candidatus Caldarchaeum sp.]